MMEEGCQFVSILGYALRCSFNGCARQKLVVVFHFLDEIEFAFFLEVGEIGACEGRIPFHACFFRLIEEAVDAGMGVLDVVDRVVAGLFLGKIDVKVHLGVECSCAEEIACCVGADFVHQFTQGDCLAGTLAHLDWLSVAEEGNHLEEHDFKIIGVVSEEFHSRLQADDISVVVSAPDVDEFVVSSFDLVSNVCDVGAEVGRHAVGTDDDSVLVIAVLCGTEPEGAVFFVKVVFILQYL